METGFSIISTALLLLFVIDPFGSVPIVLALLKDYDNEKRKKILIREVIIGLGILLIFLLFGDQLLHLFDLETESISIAGGVVFFLIAVKMIFPDSSGNNLFATNGEPMVVPIALPLIAGPSALATLILLSINHPGHTMGLIYSLLIAWGISSVIFILSPALYKILRKRGLTAMERLMGMLLLILSIQMFINGLKGVFNLG